MQEFKEKNGHLRLTNYRVPATDPDFKMLLFFQRNCRRYNDMQRGKPSSILTSERIQQLESIGLVWNASHVCEEEFQEGCRRLLEFKDRNGYLCVSTNSVPKIIQNFRIGGIMEVLLLVFLVPFSGIKLSNQSAYSA
mmetsp:Transcript_5609/g.8627  ORF Transcript_5609/g.8627 Transcript_5609/m.8627 type:complete len:137 (+) Transcript_5609:2069-2479(+)